MESNLPWSVHEFKIIQNLNVIVSELTEKNSMTVQFNFSDTSMINNVKVIKSGVWTDQAKQDWCYSLIMHVLTDFAQKACKKNTRTTTNTNKQTLGSCREKKMSRSFPLNIFGRVWGKSSLTSHDPTGHKSKSVQKPTSCF